MPRYLKEKNSDLSAQGIQFNGFYVNLPKCRGRIAGTGAQKDQHNGCVRQAIKARTGRQSRELRQLICAIGGIGGCFTAVRPEISTDRRFVEYTSGSCP
jgi:hypothetical protein